MAVAFDGFSIRDYTSKMRSVDVFKCWPFGTEEVSRKDVESWLPPMTVPKSRCSSDEVEASRSDCDDDEKPLDEEISRSESGSVRSDENVEEKLEMVCPVCRVFNAATLTAVNAHIDGCLAQTMREERRHMRIMSLKSKSKPPKKRSIAEIFEVEKEQPRIETVLKFWPFSKSSDGVSITVTKFQWWSRRLEALRSNQVDGEISRNDADSVKSDESFAAEEEKLEMVCPVCRVFNAATVTAVNAHIDGCLAQAMREERRQMRINLKPKPKPPKKRSIAEILTVAPQIKARNSEVVEVDKEDAEEEEENGKEEKYDYRGGDSSRVSAVAVVSTIKSKNTKMNRKKKSMKKLKKKSKEENYRGVESLNNGKKVMNKKKKKKNLFNNNELIAKKEDACKRKVQTQKSTRKPKGTVGNKRIALDDIDASAHKKKSSLKFLSVEKKQKVKNSDSVGKQQKAVTPVHDILKNNLKHISGRTSSDCNMQDSTEETHCDIQVIKSDRYERFSGKDDILGQKRRNSSDETRLNLSSDSLATSLGKWQSSESEEAAILEVNRSDGNITVNIERRKEVCPIVKNKQFSNTPEQAAVQNCLRACTNQEKSKHFVEKPESLTKVALCGNNLHLFDRDNTSTVHYSPYAGIIPRTLSAHQAGQISSINNQLCDSGAFNSTVKFIDQKDPTHQVATVNSNACTRTFMEPSSSYSASYDEADERPQLPSQSYRDYDNNAQALGDRPLSHMFSTGMMDSSFPLPGWGKGSVRNNCMDENFFGLPLNSHGELINFSSSGKVGINQPETSSALRVSSSFLPVNNIICQSSQEYFNISEGHFVQKTLQKDHENPFPQYPARLGVTELQSSERADIHRPNSDSCSTSNHYVRPLVSEVNCMRYPFIEQNQPDHVRNQKGNRMVSLKENSDIISLSSSQPTMRLMGKDVPIGRSSKEMQQFVEDVWADKESRRHCSEDAALEISLLRRCSQQDLISGSPLQISTENLSQSVKIQNNQALQSNLCQNGPNSEFPQPFLDRQCNYVSQNGSLGVSRNGSSYLLPLTQAPSSRAVFNRAPHEQFVSGTKPPGLSSQLQVVSNACNFTKSAFESPFLNPGVEEHAQTSWFQRSYRSLPPWLLGSAHEKLPGTSSQQFSGMSSRSYTQNIRGGNFPAPSVNHSAVVYPPSPLTSHCQMKTPLCPALIVRPPHVPVTPVTKPSSTINSGCRKIIKVADRMKLDDMSTKDHHLCKNSRKRFAANLDSTKPIKLPNIEVQESLGCVTGLTQENSSTELQRNTIAVEFDPCGDSARSKYSYQNEAQNVNPRSYLGIDSFKPDGMVSSGPVRLSPGGKHILKPAQNMEQDTSRAIYSSIPIAATTDHGRDIEIQRKLTKIYRL